MNSKFLVAELNISEIINQITYNVKSDEIIE